MIKRKEEDGQILHLELPDSRELTPEEAREIALRDAIASLDRKNWHVYEIEDTGPGGPLRVYVPSALTP